MPVYSFYRLLEPDAEPLQHMFFADDAAARYALGPHFPDGIDLWQGQRFVGRFHRQKGLLTAPAQSTLEGVSRAFAP